MFGRPPGEQRIDRTSSRMANLMVAVLMLSLACGPSSPQTGGLQQSPAPCAEEPDQANPGLAQCATLRSSASPSPTPGPVSSPSPAGSPFPDACVIDGQRYCALNPAVTQATIRTTICLVGWTGTIRPPTSLTDHLKVQQLAALNFPDQNVADYEEDHRMPLTLGGNPTDPANLAPELRTRAGGSAEVKDQEEAQLGTSAGPVCKGTRTLADAQTKLVSDWLLPGLAYKR
jgi:hypothetical protein